MIARARLRRLVLSTVILFGLALTIGRSMETPEGRESRARADVAMWTEMVTSYCAEKGRCPTTEEGLGLLTTEGYIRRLPVDPWGRPLGYAAPGPGGKPFEIWSTGPEGNARIVAP